MTKFSNTKKLAEHNRLLSFLLEQLADYQETFHPNAECDRQLIIGVLAEAIGVMGQET